MNIPDPEGTRETCPECDEFTVLAVDLGSPVRIHHGTWQAHCHKKGDR